MINPDGSKLIQPFPHYQEERSSSGTLLKRRTSYTLGGRLIALEQDGTLFYAHTDHLGSPTALMQKQGEVFVSSSIARYKPYGGTLGTPPTTTALDRGYTGHDRTAADDGLGLVYMNARYLDSSTGRFISPDTIIPDPDSPQAFNRYTYVGNSPLVGTDPDGHCWPVCTALIGGAVGGAIGGTLQAVQNVRNGQPLTADVGKAVAVGAVAGAVGATTFGIGTAVLGTGAAATVAAGALSGAAAGQAAIATGNAVDGAPIAQGLGNPRDLARDAILGGATAGVARMVGRMANGSGCSFSADTPVMTADGLEPIADVELYELVLAYDEATGETGFYRVNAIWAHEDPVVVLLTIDGELIQTTPEHPFYTSEGEWLPAAELHIGNKIWSADSDPGQVEAIEVTQSPQTMWNFTVDEAHTYFVGTGSWLVHNACRTLSGQITDDPVGNDLVKQAQAYYNSISNIDANTTIAVAQGGDQTIVTAFVNTNSRALNRLNQIATARGAQYVPPSDLAGVYGSGHAEQIAHRYFASRGIMGINIGISNPNGACSACQAYFRNSSNTNVFTPLSRIK